MKTWQILGTLRTSDELSPEDVQNVFLHHFYHFKISEIQLVDVDKPKPPEPPKEVDIASETS